jgi:hypothetical protein
MKNIYCNIEKNFTETFENIHYNIQKILLQQQKYLPQQPKNVYCNISSSTTATSQKHLLQQPKKSQHSKTICCKISKEPLQHRRNNKKGHTKPSLARHFRARRRKKGIGPELVETLAIVVSLKGGEGGRRLRSRGGG